MHILERRAVTAYGSARGAEDDDIEGLLRTADREMYGDKRGGPSKSGIRAS